MTSGFAMRMHPDPEHLEAAQGRRLARPRTAIRAVATARSNSPAGKTANGNVVEIKHSAQRSTVTRT